MNPLEELLTMFDPRFNAPGIEDPRRRMSKMGQGQGGGGIAGPEATLGRLLPFLLGIQQQNLTGFNSQVQGGGMAQPALDSAMPIGGVNAAPGAPDGRSINPGGAQPGGSVLGLDGREIQIPKGMGYGSQMEQGGGGPRTSAPYGPRTTAPRGGAGGGKVRHSGGRR